MRHSVRRVDDDAIAVRLSGRERNVLASLPGQLRAVIRSEDDPQGLRARLFPSAYEDPAREQEYRELVDEDLVGARLAALEVFAETLDRDEGRRRHWETTLSVEEAESWLSAVNDARLVLAGVVGLTDESHWEEGPDPDDPASVLLYYLGWLEEQLVTALAEDLPPPEAIG